mmetsp:Transcript_23443/g.48665  ORF Transcript_23443/g.48665 Transcript_23443/m.48665 type:complete len:450 (-) Transcript_23443:165-1514(-)
MPQKTDPFNGRRVRLSKRKSSNNSSCGNSEHHYTSMNTSMYPSCSKQLGSEGFQALGEGASTLQKKSINSCVTEWKTKMNGECLAVDLNASFEGAFKSVDETKAASFAAQKEAEAMSEEPPPLEPEEEVVIEETAVGDAFDGMWIPGLYPGGLDDGGETDLVALGLVDDLVHDFALSEDIEQLPTPAVLSRVGSELDEVASGHVNAESIDPKNMFACSWAENVGDQSKLMQVSECAGPLDGKVLTKANSVVSTSKSCTSLKQAVRTDEGSTDIAKPSRFSRWTLREDQILVSGIQAEGGKKINWKLISSKYFNGARNENQCKGRWKKQLRPGVKRSAWTQDEDDMVIMNREIGMSWPEIAAILGRMSDQVRDRWANVLDPSLNKSPITKEERQIIFEAQQKYGNKWTAIAKLLPGRSENMVKNCFHNAKMVTRRRMRKAAADAMKHQKA